MVNLGAVQQEPDFRMSIRQRCMHAHYFQIYVREFGWLEPWGLPCVCPTDEAQRQDLFARLRPCHDRLDGLKLCQ